MNKQKGFSLLEIFIALAIGIFLLGGVISIFSGMRATSNETSRYGSMQETGRFAISVLTDDLMRQGFWGPMYMPLSRSNLLAVPVAPVGECTGAGLNNGTFPQLLGHFRTIWGATATTASMMGCITDAKVGSEVLQLKRTISAPHLGALSPNTYYLIANRVGGSIITSVDPVPVINDSSNWEYQHHVFYVSEQTVGSNVIPSLNMQTLGTTITNEPLIDGVERIHFMYGVDTDSDGIVNTYLQADDMTMAFWDNQSNSQIIAVKMYVLVRDIDEDFQYENSTVYELGDVTFTAPNDNYRRVLFSSTVALRNGGVEIWE